MPASAKRVRDTQGPANGELSSAGGDISLTQQAYERLQELIITLELKPGMLLSEGQLSELLALGRSPVREAAQRLQREGLLDVHRARGIMVAPINVVRQLHCIDVRRVLEQLLAKRATRHATEEERAAMLEVADRFHDTAASDSGFEFMRTIRDAHAIKSQAARNEILESTMELFSGLSIRFWYAHYRRQPNSLRDAGAIHAQILRAIAMAEEKQACEFSDELMDFLEAFTRRTIE
jgi:DNA-binding GntR family transcriptional regulator